MTSKQFTVPKLDDLMKCHLYIGYCQEDKQPVRSLYELLRTLGLTCSLRSSLDAVELAANQNVEECQRCLLYVSSAYINDCCSTYELQEAERKVKYFGDKAVVAIIEPSVDQCHLDRFSQFTKIKLKTDRPIFTEADLKKFLSEFELKPTLRTIPKSNIGVGVALAYFYGFLQLQLPDLIKRLEKAFGHDTVGWDYVVKKMLIIIPESVNSPPQLTEPGSLEQTDWIVRQFASRSGREKREYSVPVYKLTPAGGQESYYFVGDKPACLYALYEAHHKGSVGLSKSELYQVRNEFCYTLKGLLNHPDNLASYSNQWEMLVWPDTEENPDRKQLSEFLFEQIKSKRLTEVVQVQIDGPVQATSDTETFLLQKGIEYSTVSPLTVNTNQRRSQCERLRAKRVVLRQQKEAPRPPDSIKERVDEGSWFHSEGPMKAKARDLAVACSLILTARNVNTDRGYEKYQLKQDQRGFCVIINNSTFSNPSIQERSGADVESENLKELFTQLHFKVDLRKNLSTTEMRNCLESYQGRDHSIHDAFVCCIMSHGVHGSVCSTDGLVSIMSLMELFYDDACPLLQGKPKLFFIGACQTEDRGSGLSGVQETGEAGLNANASPDSVTTSNLVPSSGDFIVSYATLPKRLAYAHQDFGGLYVKALCQNLKEDCEIDVALKNVCAEVQKLLKQYSEEYAKDQKPFHICITGTKLLFLCG